MNEIKNKKILKVDENKRADILKELNDAGEFSYYNRYESRDAAELVISRMGETLDTYGNVTVADLHDLSGVQHHYMDSKYGWVSLRDAEIIPVEGGWSIKMPPSILLTPIVDACEPDNVNHPNHYQSESGLEVIDVIKAFTVGLEDYEAVATGNALKYLCRWKKKNGIEDLKKAAWYINDLIKYMEEHDGD